VIRLTIFFFGLLVVGCGRRAPDATPDGVVRDVAERMRRVQGDPADAKAAFAFLSKRARANLTARAQRYGAASGKTIAPEAMLVPARFLLRFEPQRYVARVSGTMARVDVTGLRPTDQAQVNCVFEDGGWRVDLALPPLPPQLQRQGTGQRSTVEERP
jgi:hypothetical protein